MNVVYHFRVRGNGAEAVHIAGIAGGFQQLGHRVRFVSPSGVDPIEVVRRSQSAATRPAGAAVRALHALADRAPQLAFECLEVGYNAIAIPRLLAVVRRLQPELIYERHAFFNVAGAVAAERTGTPLVVEVNELAGYERVRDQKLVALAKDAERYAFERARLIVTVSDFLTERVKAAVGGRVPVATIPNGVTRDWLAADTPEGDREILRRSLGLSDRRVVCFVGHLSHWHDFPRLLQTLKEVRAAVPNAVLLLVGEGRERAAILEQARELGLGDAVQLVGAVPHGQVRRYIEIADAAVIPHSNQYRSPIKMFEYMGAGKPVVAPGTPPIRSVIEHARDGLLFHPGGAGFSEALTAALSDPERARALGRAAREKIAQRYTWDAHARQILELAVPALRAPRARFSPEPQAAG